MTLPVDYLTRNVPPEYPREMLSAIRQEINALNCSLVVLDDDPTGTQTVYDTPVLMNWEVASLEKELAAKTPLFYILTNTRSMTGPVAASLVQTIGRNLQQASRNTGRNITVISRSDSTLRGHFPLEVDALADALGEREAIRVIIPAFFDGGRYTLNDIHYVQEGDTLVPAGETPFAADATFGYRASDLKAWVAEKTAGRIPATAVHSISLADIRLGGPERIREKLSAIKGGDVCIVNAASLRDLEVATYALIRAENAGIRFLYRTAASFVQVRAGLAPRPLLNAESLPLAAGRGGIVVVGSYVPKTSAQVARLLQSTSNPVEISVPALLQADTRDAEMQRVVQATNQLLSEGQTAVIYTSRKLILGEDAQSSLQIGGVVSRCLVDIVRAITVQPAFMLAKGGITSSDLATKGLGITRAIVLGQLIPGVPVWQPGPESKWPGIPYIVFPGNVGSETSLSEALERLQSD
jgi:uncharacterized protein YgbK (DUF1537 family)